MMKHESPSEQERASTAAQHAVAHSDEELLQLRRERRESVVDVEHLLSPEEERDRETKDVAARFIEEELRAIPGVFGAQNILEGSSGVEVPLTRPVDFSEEKRLTKPERLARVAMGSVQWMADLVGVKPAADVALEIVHHASHVPVDAIVTHLPSGPRVLNLTTAVAVARMDESVDEQRESEKRGSARSRMQHRQKRVR